MKSILFDYGGTLDSDGTTWLERFHAIYKEEGIEAPAERFDRAFYDADDALADRFRLKGLSLEQTLRLQVDCVIKNLAPEKEACAPKIVESFLADCRSHFKRNRPMLERLRQRYRLGIVSNFYGNLQGILASEDLLGLFSTVADSGVLGVQKPEPAIFHHALKELGAAPVDCVMVGDSLPRDMRGAEGLKMRHAFLAPPSSPACCAQAMRLGALTELEGLLS